MLCTWFAQILAISNFMIWILRSPEDNKIITLSMSLIIYISSICKCKLLLLCERYIFCNMLSICNILGADIVWPTFLIMPIVS